MMCEVVENGDAVHFAAHFATATHALKSRERIDNHLALNSPGICGYYNREAVADIEVANQRTLKLSPLGAFAKYIKVGHPFGILNVARPPLCLIASPESFQLREKLLPKGRDDIAHRCTVPTNDQLSGARHQIHQTTKREFHGVEIFVDVGVIEFDVVDDRDLRQVVHELRTFIEVSGVVFVAFDDEVITAGDAKTHAKVLHDPADEKRRIHACLIDHPGS